MRMNLVRGCRRLAWVIIFLCMPGAAWVSYETSLTFAGYNTELIAARYPNLTKPHVEDNNNHKKQQWNYTALGPEYSQSAEEVAGILDDERSKRWPWGPHGESDYQNKVDAMRKSGDFPYGWEVETQRLDKTLFVAKLGGIMGAIVIFLHGSISVVAWVVGGFKQTPASPVPETPGKEQT